MTHPTRPASIPPIALMLAAAFAAAPAAEAAIDPADLRRHVEHLASDEMEGRLTGSPGAASTAQYLAQRLAELGAEPLPGQEGLLLGFDFTAGTEDDGSSLTLRAGEEASGWSGIERVQALSFSDNGTASGPVIFAGYGLALPETQDFPYDSYAGLDVDGKIVLVLRYFPEDVDQETRGLLARYSGLRYKAMQARERGAKALLVATGPRSPNAGETVPMKFDTAISGSGIVAASIGGEVAEAIFAHVEGKDLEAAQKALDDGNPHVVGFDIPDVELEVEVKVRREQKEGRNVIGMLPGKADGRAKPYVVLGAHFDHLGRGGSGNSLARKEEAGDIHYGADDNASGVAAVLEAARALATRDLGRHVVVALWSGEEIGLLGANRFLESGALDPAEIAAYVNLDMVGRARDNRLSVQAAGSSPAWPRLVERANVPVGFDVQLQDDPYLPTDSTAFNEAAVPTLNLFTGSHEDYHRPSDRPEALNYEDLGRVADLAVSIVGRLAGEEEPPEFVKVERKVQAGGDRDTVRAFTGTIPDYTTEVEGLRLSGVIGGGPADEAGLKEGDVIVEFAGQTITNIYDYTYALDAVKIGVPVQVVVMRDGERLEVTITPRARD